MLQKVARAIIEEIPATQLRRVLSAEVEGEEGVVGKGDWCGVGCGPTTGHRCGLKCVVDPTAPDVIDPTGRLGLTKKDLHRIRTELPALREMVVKELSATLEALKADRV